MIWQTWGDWPQNLTKFGIISANQTIGQIQMGFASRLPDTWTPHIPVQKMSGMTGIKKPLSFILLYNEIYYIVNDKRGTYEMERKLPKKKCGDQTGKIKL